MQIAGIALLALIVVLTITRLGPIARATVFEYERALRFRGGRFDRVLGPGVYWHLPALTRIQKVDVRPTRVAVAGQEVLSADGVAVKASLAATYQIVEADRAVLSTDDLRAAVYSELQLALRAIVSETAIDDLLQQRSAMPARLKAIAAEKLRAVGVDLHDAAVRDLTCPGELKKMFTPVVKARQDGLAALEKARGETAALRNLANAAQMIERSPNLLQLRLLQVLAQQPGNTLVLGMQQTGMPIPVREGSPELPPRREQTDGES
jgi:regulator of protease activity HflC (stomatin/prohibitin superfamily)